MAKRKKPVKRRKVRSDSGISSRAPDPEIPFEELTPRSVDQPPADPMLVAYIDAIHHAASVRDRSVYNAQQKFAWDLSDAWKKWKGE
jgi:hypothetical protein